MEVPVLQQRHPALVEVVDIVHPTNCRPATTAGGRAHQARMRPEMPPPRPSSDRSAAALRARRVARLVAVAALAQRAHVAGRRGRVGEAQLERVQRRPGRGLAARALAARARAPTAPAARRARQRRSAERSRGRRARARRRRSPAIRHHGAGSAVAATPAPRSDDAGRRRSWPTPRPLPMRRRLRRVGRLAARGRVGGRRVERDPAPVRVVDLDPGVRVEVADDVLAGLEVRRAGGEAGRRRARGCRPSAAAAPSRPSTAGSSPAWRRTGSRRGSRPPSAAPRSR